MNHNWFSAKGEQRENVQSQHLSTDKVSGVGTGCINTFVIWRSAQGELHRSEPLSKIYSTFIQKIHVFAKSYPSFLLRRGTACSLCWAFSLENPSLSTSPLMNLPEAPKIFDAQTETSVSEKPDQILHGILWQPH